jgi:phosphatidylserine/phosphatidylglycerophosphate/cardiolipin synthase-like enzyme
MNKALITLLAVFALNAQTKAEIEVYFSPKGGCTAAITRTIDAATNTVLIQAYSFTSDSIAKSVVQAHRRGVKVSVILDKSNQTAKYSAADFLNNAGVPTFIDAKHAIAHNKLMIVDGYKVITGSFNFSKAAEERNSENILLISDREIARQYTTNWNHHAAHSQKYTGKQTAPKISETNKIQKEPGASAR